MPPTPISDTTYTHYSVQDIILPAGNQTQEQATSVRCGSQHPRQLQGSAVKANTN